MASRRSTSCCSSADSPRNSAACPTRQPAASSDFRFLTFMLIASPFVRCARRLVVVPESLPARADDFIGKPLGFLREDFDDDHRIVVESVNDSPVVLRVANPQFRTPRPDGRQRASVRHREGLAGLQQAQEDPGLDSPLPGERRRLHAAVQPDERLAGFAPTGWKYISDPVSRQLQTARETAETAATKEFRGEVLAACHRGRGTREVATYFNVRESRSGSGRMSRRGGRS